MAATLSVAALLTLLPVASLAAPPTAFPASIARSGEVIIRENEDAEAFVSIRPALFETGWQYRTVSYDKASMTAGIAAASAGSVVKVTPTITANGKNIRISCVFLADKDTPVNSLHVSVTVPVRLYIGGTAKIGTAAPVTVPTAPKDTHLLAGASGAATLETKEGNRRLVVTPEAGSTLMIQDNRVFNGADLEVRVGNLGEHVLKSGQAETVAFTVELPEAVQLQKEEPFIITAGPDWIPLAPKSLAIVPGSALDFSRFLSDAPAGKYGWVTARPDGHFGFEKRDKPQRFYGVNLCFSANYLTHEESDAFAERLQRLGYNAVRIHHYEGDLIDQTAPDSLTLRADNLDKLDYLMAALKKHGVYVTTDLFVSRPVKPAEMGLEAATGDDFKDAILVSRPAMENWKAFSKKLLTHVNPYTKLAYKDEPALAFISVINEPNLTNGRLGGWKGKLHDLFAAEWKTWYAKRYPGKTVIDLPNQMENNANGRDVAAFFAFLHQRGYDEMKTFLRKEIGTKALLTYLNGWSETPSFMAVRQSFDYVDNHFYWDHPSFLEASWGLPSTGWSGNGSAVAAGGAGPDGVSMTRLDKKPFTVTEWDYVAPNRYRAESGLIMGTASALQDWDAIWHFAYSHWHDSVVSPQPIDYFNVGQDPIRQASERTALLLFLRGDVRPSTTSLTVPVATASLLAPGNNLPTIESFRDQTLIKKVGVRVEANPPKTIIAPISLLKQRGKRSDTGEITVDAENRVFQVETPRSIGVTAPPGEARYTLRKSTVTIHDSFATVTIAALDDLPVENSHHLLITHLTDLQNTNERFSAPDRRIIESWGTLPYLIRRGSATVILSHGDAKKLKAWRLDTNGNRVAPLPVGTENDYATLELSTNAPDGSATLYYEVMIP